MIVFTQLEFAAKFELCVCVKTFTQLEFYWKNLSCLSENFYSSNFAAKRLSCVCLDFYTVTGSRSDGGAHCCVPVTVIRIADHGTCRTSGT